MRALLFTVRAFGVLADPLELAREDPLARRLRGLLRPRGAAAFASRNAEYVPLEHEDPPAVELAPSGSSSARGTTGRASRGATPRRTSSGTARATPSSRRRDGSSARRGAGGRGAHQRPAERHAPPLAARERRDVGVAGRAPRAPPSPSRAAGRRPSPSRRSISSCTCACSSSTACIASASSGSASFSFEPLVAREQRTDVRDALLEVPATSFAGSRCGSCSTYATRSPSAASPPRRAAVSVAGEDPQERRLPRSVDAHDPHLRVRGRCENDKSFRRSRLPPMDLVRRATV